MLGGVVADYGYRVTREGGNTVLAFDTRSVSKIRGLLLIIFSGLFGVFFLMLAVTSRNDRILASAIFLFSLICIVGSIYLVKKREKRAVTFTPIALLVDGDGPGGLASRRLQTTLEDLKCPSPFPFPPPFPSAAIRRSPRSPAASWC